MSILADAGYEIPRRGWPGRRRAIARVVLHVVVMFVIACLLLFGFLGCVLLVWASMLPAPR